MSKVSLKDNERQSISIRNGFLLLEPDLTGFAGHYFGYVSELAAACQKRGIPLVIVSNRKVTGDVTNHLEALGANVEAKFRRLAWFRRALLSGLWFAGVGMAAARRHPDLVPVTLSGRIPLLIGAAATAAATPGLSVFQVMNWQTRIQHSAPARASRMVRLVASLGHRAGLRFASESASLKPALSAYLEQEVYALPTIAPWPNVPLVLAQENAIPRVGMLGAGRWEKNLAQFVEAVNSSCLGLGQPGFRIVVQIDETFGSYTRECYELLSSLRDDEIELELIDKPLSGAGFIELLLSLDVVALPYQPSASATAASGIFTQALGLGVVPVVPAGSWMAAQAEEERVGIVYDQYTAEGLRAALDHAVEHRVQLRAKIMERAADWRRRHSVDALLDRLLAVVSAESN